MTHSYKTLMKDKEIIATEVMHEYNEQVRDFIMPHSPVAYLLISLYIPESCPSEKTPL